MIFHKTLMRISHASLAELQLAEGTLETVPAELSRETRQAIAYQNMAPTLDRNELGQVRKWTLGQALRDKHAAQS